MDRAAIAKRSVGIANRPIEIANNRPIEIAQPRQTPTANFVKPIIKTPTLNLYPYNVIETLRVNPVAIAKRSVGIAHHPNKYALSHHPNR